MRARLFYLIQFHLASLRHWWLVRFSPAGKLLGLGLIASAVLGVDIQRNLAHQVFCLLLVLFLLALLGLWLQASPREKLHFHRHLPRMATVGESLLYRLEVSNNAAIILAGGSLSDKPADPRPSWVRFMAEARRGEALYPRWQRLCSGGRSFFCQTQWMTSFTANATQSMMVQLTPLRRGRLSLEAVELAQSEFLGLLRSRWQIVCQDSLLVLPRRYRLPAIDLPGQRAVLQGQQALSSSVADAEEFQSLRDYRAGDPLRWIHWKSWARCGKPVIREHQDEFSIRHALVLDTFGEGIPDEVFEEAVSLAASCACTVETRESLLDLLFVGDRVYCETAGRAHGPVERLLEVLAGVTPCHTQVFQVLPQAVLSQSAALSGCICILLAWDAERAAFVRQLDVLGLPRRVFVLTDERRSNLPALTEDGLPADVFLLQAGHLPEGLARL